MNQEIKAKWVAALRSGKYPQGKEFLNNGGKFCCLGVLCEIAIDEGLPVNKDMTSVEVHYDDRLSTLPRSVCTWAGLGNDLPSAGRESLSSLNDNGMPFTEIADIIEREL